MNKHDVFKRFMNSEELSEQEMKLIKLELIFIARSMECYENERTKKRELIVI